MINLDLLKSNLYPFVDYEYSTNREECRCEDMCRCGTIENPEVLPSITTYFGVLNRLCDIKNTTEITLEHNLLLRFLKKTIDCECFEFDISSGYYGEELNDISYNDPDFNKKVRTFVNLPRTQQLKEVLNLEYGYVLPEIDIHQEWEFEKVPIDSIKSNPHVQPYKEIVEEYGWHIHWGIWRTSKDYKQVKNYKRINQILKLFAPLTTNLANNKYHLVDGYHRLAALSKTYKNADKTQTMKFDEIYVIHPVS